MLDVAAMTGSSDSPISIRSNDSKNTPIRNTGMLSSGRMRRSYTPYCSEGDLIVPTNPLFLLISHSIADAKAPSKGITIT